VELFILWKNDKIVVVSLMMLVILAVSMVSLMIPGDF
jgi:hypothetical protein